MSTLTINITDHLDMHSTAVLHVRCVNTRWFAWISDDFFGDISANGNSAHEALVALSIKLHGLEP